MCIIHKLDIFQDVGIVHKIEYDIFPYSSFNSCLIKDCRQMAHQVLFESFDYGSSSNIL